MTAKIVSSVLTLIATAAGAAFLFIMMLVALNGYHGNDANYGVAAYAVLSLLNIAAMSGLAYFLAGFLMKREFKGPVAGLIAVPVVSIVGIALLFVCLLIGVLVTDVASKNF